MPTFLVGILTVSDRAASGSATDASGPAVADELARAGGEWRVARTTVVPDDAAAIRDAVCAWTDGAQPVDLLLTTGGTGFGVRDVTPEAITPLLDKLAPGIPIAMINESLKITPFAVLARPIAGVRKRTVVVSLPGSPKGARENLRAVLAALAHAVELAKGDSGQKTHAEMAKEGRHDCSAADDYVPKTDRRENDHDHDHDASRGTHSHAHSHSHSHSHDGHSGPKHPLGTPVARRPRTSPYPLISVDEALAIIFRHCPTLPAVDVPVDENLLGCVLAADAYAKEDVPGYPASIVDGYAVIASDGPGEYPVLAPSTAGAPAEAHLTPGHIARVTTGAPVPPGTTAVVMVEYTTVEKASEDGRVEERVRIHEPAEKGDKIREVGVDCKAGTLVMKAGEQVTLVGGEVGILASVGLSSVSVYRRPRIGVLSSGNEVVDLSNPELRYGQVRDTNRPSLIAALRSTGFDAVDLGIATDDADQLAAAISRALGEGGCDALITTGGVSMGELDLLKPVLEEKLHGTIHFGRVKMKPGKPTTFVTLPSADGSLPHKPVFALPGNPVSALVCFYVFVLPGLCKMAGRPEKLATVRCKLAHDVRLDPRPEYQRAHVAFEGGGLWASTTGVQRSSRMLSMKGANALLILPATEHGKESLLKGTEVDALLISNLA